MIITKIFKLQGLPNRSIFICYHHILIYGAFYSTDFSFIVSFVFFKICKDLHGLLSQSAYTSILKLMGQNFFSNSSFPPLLIKGHHFHKFQNWIRTGPRANHFFLERTNLLTVSPESQFQGL